MNPVSVWRCACLLVAGLAVAATHVFAQSMPNERLLNKDVAVYRRSPTELWVYDTRPEAGVGWAVAVAAAVDLALRPPGEIGIDLG